MNALPRRVAATVAIGVSLLSACRPARTAVALPFTVDTLPNGLILVVHEDHSVPIVAANIWYHVGSADERPGRTGLAHLFEHLMFMGSEHAPYPSFDERLEAAGADNNASTSSDYTNYYENGPANALPLMLWLEADRMGFFVSTLDSMKVDRQRDVVKNERRQRIDNQPYGLAYETLLRMLYPPGHPYSWPVIGSMADLSAATVGDTKAFFRTYYAPNNASLVVAGDVRTDEVRTLVRQYFGDIPRGPAISRSTTVPAVHPRDTAAILDDRVPMPRIHYSWHTVRSLTPDDYALRLVAYLLAGAKNSRLTQPLVYDLRLAADADANQDGGRLDGAFVLTATARPGHALPELRTVIDRAIGDLAARGPTDREMEQAKNATEASMLRRLERVSEKADLLNRYLYFAGDPGFYTKELAGLRGVTADDVRRVVRTYLVGPKVVLSIVPEGRRALATDTTEVTR